ncbi:MAG: hypothetical protein R2932_33790 [Caldilineaceae bacterium]
MTQLSRRVFFIHLLLITTICGLALGVRLWQIDQLPPGFHFDEALKGWRRGAS